MPVDSSIIELVISGLTSAASLRRDVSRSRSAAPGARS
jgi:hypothetical protein